MQSLPTAKERIEKKRLRFMVRASIARLWAQSPAALLGVVALAVALVWRGFLVLLLGPRTK